MDGAAGEDDVPEGLAPFADALRVELLAAARRQLEAEEPPPVDDPR